MNLVDLDLTLMIVHYKIVYLVQFFLTKNADIDKYGYSGYGIGFDRGEIFTFASGGFGQNVLIF